MALGGNAILPQDASGTAAEQRRTIAVACGELAALVADGHEIVVTHGNGPQVGALLLQQRAAERDTPPLPLDVLDAQTQGQVGYLIVGHLGAALTARGLERPVAAVVTQVVVDPDDAAFARPDKPVGPHYTEVELAVRAERTSGRQQPDGENWTVDGEVHRKQAGTWRRVVPSPEPLDVVEAGVISRLLEAGVVPVAAGGGGCPVAMGEDGPVGVEAVIDKDRTAALLVGLLRADALLILTDVDRVALDYGSDRQRWLDRLAVDDAHALLADGQFAAGSMGPKVQAAARVAAAGGIAVITSLERAVDGLRGAAGTRIG